MSSSTLTRQASASAERSALLSADREPRTASKRSWILRRTSQSHTPSITTVPGVPEPQETPQTVRTETLMVIRTVLLDQVARPVRTEAPVSVELPPSVDRLDGAVPGHFRGVARAGMTVGPLSVQPAGALTTATPTATHEQAILKIRFSIPRAIFKNFKI
jgi:hypothetical protein